MAGEVALEARRLGGGEDRRVAGGGERRRLLGEALNMPRGGGERALPVPTRLIIAGGGE